MLVGIASVGVNPVETYIRSGTRPQPLPYIPGADGAGKVLQLGDDVKELQVRGAAGQIHHTANGSGEPD